MAYESPEQAAARILTPLGCILTNDVTLPYAFADKTGRDFTAKADFYQPELDLYIEIKCNHLNGRTSKESAEKAYNRIDPWRKEKYPTYYQIQTQWNHAAAKHAIVQSTIGAPQYIVVFTMLPDEDTMKRVVKEGIQAYSLEGLARILRLQLAFKRSKSTVSSTYHDQYRTCNRLF